VEAGGKPWAELEFQFLAFMWITEKETEQGETASTPLRLTRFRAAGIGDQTQMYHAERLWAWPHRWATLSCGSPHSESKTGEEQQYT